MPEKHATLGPSSAHRWINCPGSVRLSELFTQTSGPYADEGTIAHKYLEESVKQDKDGMAAALDQAADFYRDHPCLGETSKSLKTNIDEMVGWLREQYVAACTEDPAARIYSEQQVNLSEYISGGFGTADVTIAQTGKIHIVDLKYGKGVRVDAVGNPQLRLYALGMLEMLDMVYDVETVRMTIYQPRLYNISTDCISAEDLRTWGRETVMPAARLTEQDDAPFMAGDWCQFCPAKKTCRTRSERYLKLQDFRDQHTLSDSEIGAVLQQATDLEKWISDLREAAQEAIMEGGKIPGWKLVEVRSIRKFTAGEADIVAAAERAGYQKPMLFESRMLSLSAIEKMMGKKAFSEILGPYTEKPPGAPTLVPESDKRPACTGMTAKDVFADEIDQE